MFSPMALIASSLPSLKPRKHQSLPYSLPYSAVSSSMIGSTSGGAEGQSVAATNFTSLRSRWWRFARKNGSSSGREPGSKSALMNTVLPLGIASTAS